MFYVYFVTFAFCKLFFCHDSQVVGIDAFKVVPLPTAKQRIFNTTLRICPFYMLPVYFCTFWWNHVILLQTVAKWRCIKLCAVFFWTTL